MATADERLHFLAKYGSALDHLADEGLIREGRAAAFRNTFIAHQTQMETPESWESSLSSFESLYRV